MKKLLSISAIMLLVLGLTSFSFAQGRQVGSISGTVLDTDGNPLPGCTVTLSGLKHLGTTSFITNEAGRFRFPALAPGGGYEVKVEMPNFKTTIQKDLFVNIAKNTGISIELEVTTLQEEIVVVAESPTVDVTSSKMSINYSAQFIANIPMARDVYDIQNTIPGAIEAGAYERASSILGSNVKGTVVLLDGAFVTDPITYYMRTNISVDTFEEVEVGLGAHAPETGQADGAVINIVTKSGGNRFSGAFTTKYTNDSLAQNLISVEDAEALSLEPPTRYKEHKDFSVTLGGPIIKDKLWFFVNGRRMTFSQALSATPETRIAVLAAARPDYSFNPKDFEHQMKEQGEWMGFAKLTFRITDNIKYTAMLNYFDAFVPVDKISSSRPYTYSDQNPNKLTIFNQKLNWILGPNTFLDIGGSYYIGEHAETPQEESIGQYTSYDRAQNVSWGSYWANKAFFKKHFLPHAMITHFQDDFLGASHEFKAGVEYEWAAYHRDESTTGGNPWRSYWQDFAAGDPYYYNVGDRIGRLTFKYGVLGEKGLWMIKDEGARYSLFIQDSITTGRWAFNVGVRFDKSWVYYPENYRPDVIATVKVPAELQNPALGTTELLEALAQQIRDETGHISCFDEVTTPYQKVINWATFSPRIGLVYDLFGDGKTAVKLSFSRYYEPAYVVKYNNGNIFQGLTTNFEWTDVNANVLMDLPGVDSYRIRSTVLQDTTVLFYPDDLKPPITDELIFGVEHELVRDFRLGLQFISKRGSEWIEDSDMINGYDPTATDADGLIWIPYTFTDPGWDQELGTGDDQELTVYGLRNGRPSYESMLAINPPEAKRNYTALLMTFDKRMSNNWMLKGSVLYSAFKGNYSPSRSGAMAETGAFDNPNVMINSYGRCAYDHPWQVKIMGSYILPQDFVISWYFQHRSGSPWARSFNRIYFPDSLNVQQSSVSVRAEPLGTRRNASYTTMDLRLEKGFKFGTFGDLRLYVDIYNLGGRSGISINENPNLWYRGDRTPVEWYPDSNYGRITSVYGVRTIHFGLKFTF